jgi:tRNA threonylcarbamoyladenosine biosynthesis protein TsaE
MSETLISSSADETRRLGEALGRLLEAGDTVLLSGELGAGKTVFVQGMASGLGYEGTVSSKSFVLLGQYEGRIMLYHADLYRLDQPEQVDDLALEELILDGAVAIEWPERAGGLVPAEHILIEFEIESAESRRLRLLGNGERSRELVGAFAGAVRAN